jgi:hypothetical protein
VQRGAVQLQKEVLSFREATHPVGKAKWERTRSSVMKVVSVLLVLPGGCFGYEGLLGQVRNTLQLHYCVQCV